MTTLLAHRPIDPSALRCPDCGGSLQPADNLLICDSCSAQWQVRNGIPLLLKQEVWGFTEREKAKAINALAASQGWRVAADEYARTVYPDRYDYHYQYICSEARADFCVLANLTPESRVLDIGSGWGNLTTGIARIAGDCYALDTCYENLEFIALRADQEGLRNVRTVGATATQLPFPDDFFDLIVMNGVLEWVGTNSDSASPLDLQKQALRQAWRKLKPGGKLYVAIENRWGFVYFAGRADPHTGLRFVTLLPRPLADLYSRIFRKEPYRALTHSRSALEKMFIDAGFAQTDCYYPIPGYQDYRFIATFKERPIFDFLLLGLRAFPRFSNLFYVLARVALPFGALRLLRLTYPSLAVVGSK